MSKKSKRDSGSDSERVIKILEVSGYNIDGVKDLLTEQLVKKYLEDENLGQLKASLDDARESVLLSRPVSVEVAYTVLETDASQFENEYGRRMSYVPVNTGMFGGSRDHEDYNRVSRAQRSLSFVLVDDEQDVFPGRRALFEELVAYMKTRGPELPQKGISIAAKGSFRLESQRHDVYTVSYPAYISGQASETGEWDERKTKKLQLRVLEDLPK